MKGPKRRKKKDNPYTILHDMDKDKFYVLFNSNGVINKIEVSNDVFSAFDRFELDDISKLHKQDKHIDLRPIDENYIYKKDEESIEEYIIRKNESEELHNAINQLTEIQKRRIKYYYFEDLNFSEIARLEKCNESSIRESIYSGIEKLKNILK